MARKADVKGGNGDVVFDAETGTARKYLRNTSTAEKVTRFKRELAVFQELCKNPIPNVVEVTDVYIDEDKIAESYVEMKKYDGIFDTVYFGGGTPSILESDLICRILSEARAAFTILPESEITIECNPSKNLSDDFKAYAKSGINRISLGMQSAVDSERFALGRAAGKKEVVAAIDGAKNAGIENISLDLMIGTPKQTLASLEETFDFIDKTNVKHISAYMLKIESGTKFFEMRDRLSLPDDDEVAEMYLKTVKSLAELGFVQYEISNFAKPGFESRHNIKYWQLVPYLGIGASAHSFWGGKRFYYDRDFNKIPDGDGGSTEEKIMLGLRLTQGIDKSLVDKPYDKFVKAGFMTESGDKIALTPKGMLVSNTIISELI